jgi:phosphoenolpyruvate-protein kinase (PTS system EI component)
LKLDENLSRSAAELCRKAGHDVMTVRDQRLQGAPDEKVFEISAQEGRVLVTLDRDLGQVLRFPPDKSAGIVVIDAGPRASHRGLLARTRELFSIFATRSPERALWIVEPGRVRIHLAKDEK